MDGRPTQGWRQSADRPAPFAANERPQIRKDCGDTIAENFTNDRHRNSNASVDSFENMQK